MPNSTPSESTSEPGAYQSVLVRPSLDLAVIIALATATLDVVSTMIFVYQQSGIEQNPILKPLIEHSPLWIPIYLWSRPPLTLVMALDHRIATATWAGIVGVSMGINNFSGITMGDFILNRLGLDRVIVVLAFPLALLVFSALHYCSRSSWRLYRRRVAWLLGWLLVAGVIEGLFVILGYLLPS